MKKIIPLLFLFIFLFPPLCFSNESIAGIWSASVRTKGGLGGQWTYTSEGEVSFTFGALVDFEYEIDNDKISIDTNEPDSPQKNKKTFQRFTIEGETLTLYAENSNEVARVMKRAGRQNKKEHPIVGDWTFTHSTGGTALMRYSSKGIVQLCVPFTVDSGTYRLKENTLIVKFHDREQIEIEYIKNGKKLILKNSSKGKDLEYQLFEY